MADNREPPRVFISYSWSSDEHQSRVVELAERLSGDGVHVTLDIWDLQPGHDKYAFMERMVTDPKIGRVLLILDKRYAEKADKREGGVGSESQIISPELYQKVAQGKFIPIVAERDEQGEPFLPAYLRGRIYIDLSPQANFAEGYEALLRHIFERPARQRPVIGAPPAFLEEPSPLPPSLRFRLEAATKAIEDGRREAQGHLRRFLGECLAALETFRIREAPSGHLDDEILRRIHDMTPVRDQLLQVVEAICTFSKETPLYKELQTFLERSAPLMFRPKDVLSWTETWFDNYRFFLRELLLYVTAILLRHERFEQLNALLGGDFCFATPDGNLCHDFGVFNASIGSLNGHRKQRLELNRISVVADLIKERAPAFGIDFDSLIEADLILALKSVMGSTDDAVGDWFPETAVFTERTYHAIPLFSRFEAGRNSDAIGILFGTASPGDFLKKLNDAYTRRHLDTWRAGYHSIAFRRLTGVANISAPK